MMFLSKVYHLLLIGGVFWLLQVAGSTAEDLGSTQNQQVPVELKLTNNGPAILDSQIHFHARLVVPGGSPLAKALFTYKWYDNSSDPHQEVTETGREANVTFIYKSRWADPGTYYMTVEVHRKGYSPMLVSGSMAFELTGTLNGNLRASQRNITQRFPNMFAPRKMLNMSLNLLDTFHKNISVYREYDWFINETKLATTKKPFYAFKPRRLGQYSLIAYAHFLLQPATFLQPNISKNGTFSQAISVKEEVTKVSVTNTSSNSLFVHQTFHANVTCTGSPPFTLCTSVQVNSTALATECAPALMKSPCFFQLRLNLSLPGSYTLRPILVNDVSQKQTVIRFEVKYPGEPPQPPPLFLIPIICILMLTTIILFVLSSYMTDRPGWGRNIEVADFHFSQSGSHNQLTMHLQAWGNKLMVALRLKPPQQPTVVDATPREDGEPFLNRSIRNQTPTTPSRAYGSTGGFLG